MALPIAGGRFGPGVATLPQDLSVFALDASFGAEVIAICRETSVLALPVL